MPGSLSRPYFRRNASKLHSAPRWPSSTSLTSYGVAPRFSRFAHHLIGRHVDELRLLIDEPLDKPPAGGAVDTRMLAVIHFMAVRRPLNLRAEDDERAEREHAEEREERGRNGRPPAGARREERRGEAEDHDDPEDNPNAEDLV